MFVLRRTYEKLANDYITLMAIYENNVKNQLEARPKTSEYELRLTRKSLSHIAIAIELDKNNIVTQLVSVVPKIGKPKRKNNHLRKATKKV